MTVANGITWFRVAMIPVILACILLYTPQRDAFRLVALGLYVLSGLSDVLDGYVARRFNQMSRFGARLDPLGDKLITNLAFVFLAANPHFGRVIPYWFPVLVLARDLVIVLGAYAINERYGRVRVRPLWTGKVTTALLMSALVAVLLRWQVGVWLVWASVFFVLISGAHYILFGFSQVRARKKASHA